MEFYDLSRRFDNARALMLLVNEPPETDARKWPADKGVMDSYSFYLQFSGWIGEMMALQPKVSADLFAGVPLRNLELLGMNCSDAAPHNCFFNKSDP